MLKYVSGVMGWSQVTSKTLLGLGPNVQTILLLWAQTRLVGLYKNVSLERSAPKAVNLEVDQEAAIHADRDGKRLWSCGRISEHCCQSLSSFTAVFTAFMLLLYKQSAGRRRESKTSDCINFKTCFCQAATINKPSTFAEPKFSLLHHSSSGLQKFRPLYEPGQDAWKSRRIQKSTIQHDTTWCNMPQYAVI